MKYLALTIVAVCLFSIHSVAQFASEMLDYRPAPGQLINTDGVGSYSAARSVTGGLDGLVSLGSFGGSIIFGFDQPIKNESGNPYGVDFVIFGNVQRDWAEPGIVQVMKDVNQNGVPDDVWYELAGSEYFFSTTRHKASVTYFNPLFTGEEHVRWGNSENETGYIFSNSFHKQDYFPSALFFENIPAETINNRGTRIAAQVDISNPAMVKCFHRRFGYADNNPRKNTNFNQPDNPYTDEIEGCGGDAMDISWAVDENGNYIELDQIDFVRIYTGVLANAGWCGEISTEISGIADVSANQLVNGTEKCIVINRVSEKILAGNFVQLEAIVFQQGRPLFGKNIIWNTDDPAIATIDYKGKFEAKGSGIVTITASLADDASVIGSTLLEVISPSDIELLVDSKNIRIGDEKELKISVNDINGASIGGLKYNWNISNDQVLSFYERSGRYYIKGLREGSSELSINLSQKQDVNKSIIITVLSASAQKEVFITVKDEKATIVPRDNFSVSNFDLNPFVDNRQVNYGIDEVENVTVAHAIAQVFTQQGIAADFRFRDDEKGGGSLYVWKVPKGNPDNLAFVYGYGGYSATGPFSKSWIVLLNNNQLITDFDKYLIKNGDELILYHVPDITSDWKVSCFLASKNDLSLNDTLEVYSTELTCALGAERKIQVKSSSPIKFQEILVDNQTVYFNGDPVLTDETGTAALRFFEAGTKKITSGIDEMIVTVGRTLSTNLFEESEIVKIWPQPANDFLNIEFAAETEYNVRIFTLSGHCKLKKSISSKDRYGLSLEGLEPGLYVLSVSSKNGTSNCKIIIQ